MYLSHSVMSDSLQPMNCNSPCYSLKLHSNVYISPFLLCLSLLFFSQLFVKPPQTTILPFCISFSWGWSRSLPPIQFHKPLFNLSAEELMLEKTLESPMNHKIKPVHSKGNRSWIFIERTNAEAETPLLWPPDAKSWLIGKDPDAGKDWRWEEKGMREDEMVGWHY